jgi:DNA processing protein
MNSIEELPKEKFPGLLREMHDPPDKLYIKGVLPPNDCVYLTVIGSRKASAYGKEATEILIQSLKGLPVVIVSGLAFGIDAIAHKAALDAGLATIAVPGSGLGDDVLYPASNRHLAERIVKEGGALISPFKHDLAAAPWTFPQRNRIMAGISHATLVIEAEIKSGTLITSKYATECNRDVFTVPGSIFSAQSQGPHMLIRLGATPITSGKELIDALGFTSAEKIPADYSNLSPDELKIIEVLDSPQSKESLIDKSGFEAAKVNSLVSLLEIKGLIEEKYGELCRV